MYFFLDHSVYVGVFHPSISHKQSKKLTVFWEKRW